MAFQQPIRYLEDHEVNAQPLLPTNSASANAKSNGLKSTVRIVGGKYSTAKHTFTAYDNYGNPQNMSKEDEDNYYYYKGAVLVIEFLLFLYFLVFGIGAFATIIAEIELGSGWLIGWTSMVVIISVFAAVGLILMGLYTYFSVQFMKHGDEQLDELLANVFAMVTMFACAFGLLVKYFVLNDTDNTMDDLNFRRILFTVIASYGVFGLIIIIRGIARHLSIEKEVMINYQHWRYSEANCPPEIDSKSKSADTVYAHVHTAKPHRRVIAFMVMMWISTAITIALSIWLLYLVVGADSVPDFRTVYLTNFITLGIVYILLTITWVLWNLMSEHFKACFTAHFDVFYGTHAVYMAVVIFMLIGYRYVYYSVPDDFFESPGVTVPALKLAYFTKLAILMFVLLPLLAMGIAKGTCLMINEWPVDLPKYRKAIEQAQKKQISNGK